MSQSHVKTLLSHTIIYGIGLVLNRSIGFLLLPLYTNYFSPGDWGVYTIVSSLWIFLSVFYSLGFENSFMKFFIEEKNKEKKKTIYSSILIFLVLSSVVLSFILYFSSLAIAAWVKFDDAAKAISLIKILAVLLFFDTIYRIPLLLLRAELNTKVYTYLTIVTVVINIGLNIFLIIGQGYGVEAIFYSYIISVLITTILCLFITKSYLIPKISFSEIKKFFGFGLNFIFIGLFILFIDISDRFFLKYYFDESVVGIYSANYRLGTVMSLIIAAYKFSWTPYFMNIQENPDNKKIISNIFTYFVFTGLFLFLFFSFFTDDIVKIKIGSFYVMNESYWGGLKIIPIVLLSYFFSGLYSNLNVASFFSNRTDVLLKIAMLGIAVNIIFNIALIPSLEMTGAALSTLLTYVVMFIALYYKSQQLFYINYDLKKIGIMAFVAFLLYYAENILSNIISNQLMNIVLSIFIIGLFALISMKFNIIRYSQLIKLFKREIT